MSLNADIQTYKLEMPVEGDRQFFIQNKAPNWDFFNYYRSTHNIVNKNKSCNSIANDYNNDLAWIARLPGVAQNVRDHANNLKKCPKDRYPKLFL